MTSNNNKKMEILFRGKAINGVWHYGDLLHRKDGFAIKEGTDGFCWCEVERETVGQFTGLVDKNGQKIFECDILRVCDSKFEEGKNYMSVYWDPKNTGYNPFIAADCLGGWGELPENCEVIGNIFDNPNLMKRKKAPK